MAIGAFASANTFTPKLNAAGEELRLIKTSDADNGTWYTEQEKLDLFISTPSCAHFMDITETQVRKTLDAVLEAFSSVSDIDIGARGTPHCCRKRFQSRQTTICVISFGGLPPG